MRNYCVCKTFNVHLYIVFLWDVETPSPTDSYFTNNNVGENCVRPKKYVYRHAVMATVKISGCHFNFIGEADTIITNYFDFYRMR